MVLQDWPTWLNMHKIICDDLVFWHLDGSDAARRVLDRISIGSFVPEIRRILDQGAPLGVTNMFENAGNNMSIEANLGAQSWSLRCCKVGLETFKSSIWSQKSGLRRNLAFGYQEWPSWHSALGMISDGFVVKKLEVSQGRFWNRSEPGLVVQRNPEELGLAGTSRSGKFGWKRWKLCAMV